MRTIIFFDQNSSVGGGQIVLLNSIEAARKIADRIILVAPLGGALEQRILARFGDAVELFHVNEAVLTVGHKTLSDVPRFLVLNFSILRYWRLVRDADLICVNGGRVIFGALLLSLLCRRPALYHLHIDHSRLEKLLFVLVARFRFSVGFIANSEFNLRKFQAACPSLAEDSRVVAVENALDRRYENLRFVDRFALSKQQLRVVTAGTFTPEKGQDMVVELAHRLPTIEFHLVGNTHPGAESWVDALSRNAPSNVFFHAPASDMPGFIDQHGIHINLVPSRWEETFGLVSIEGMASSCITLVRKSGALPAIAAKTGAIVCENVDTMGVELERLAAMPSTDLARLARQQYEATMIAYAPDRYLEEISSIMRAALPLV